MLYNPGQNGCQIDLHFIIHVIGIQKKKKKRFILIGIVTGLSSLTDTMGFNRVRTLQPGWPGLYIINNV